jgi:hypothetical protein
MTIRSAEVAPSPVEPVLAWESLPQALRQRLTNQLSILVQREWQRHRARVAAPATPPSTAPQPTEVAHE